MIASLACTLLLFSPTSGDGGPDLTGIRSADLMQTVEHLASPRFQGRLAGSPGYMAAAKEAAELFRQYGLRPAGEDGYFQHLDIEYNDIEVCRLAFVGEDGRERPLTPGKDFTCRGFTGSGEVRAPVVFVGYGLSQPGKGYDDYAGIDTRGKVVLAYKEVPPFTVDSTGWGKEWMPRPKARVAAEHGALALLIVSRPGQARPQKPIGSTMDGEAAEGDGLPMLQLDLPVAEEMVHSAGFSLADLESRIDSSKAPASHELPISVRLRVAAHYQAKRPSVNVVGILDGSDPALRNEFVVLGAHLDHVGSQGRAEEESAIYFPGANDNASGSASILAIAAALHGTRPRRSILFGLWTSEEAGLLGARHFVERLPFPRDSVVAYLNFDCVGHGDSIDVGGGKDYPVLWRIARDLDGARDLAPSRRTDHAGGLDGARSGLMVESTGGGGGADAAPFDEAGIPNLYFASRFSYTHLHQTTDTPETLNPALLQSIARLGCATAWKIAQGEYRKEPRAEPRTGSGK